MALNRKLDDGILDIPQPVQPKVHPRCPFCPYSQVQIKRHLENVHKLAKAAVYAARKYVIGESLEQLNHKLAISSHQQISP